MLPTQKEAWGKSVSPDVNIQKTPQRTLSAEIGSQSTTDSESSFDFCSLGWQFCRGGRKSHCLN
jgi:hypothetical protein